MSKRICAIAALASVAWVASDVSGIPLVSNQSVNPAAPALNPSAISDSGVPAPAGQFWSEVENDLGVTTSSNTNAGVSGNRVQSSTLGHFRVADNFTVPAGGWFIQTVQMYGYQTGATSSPINAANLQIWNGRPGDVGASVIFGDTTTNRLATSVFSGIYRVFNTTTPPPGTAPGTTRQIFDNTLTVSGAGLFFAPGTYWIDAQFNTINSAGTWFMPNTTHNESRSPLGLHGPGDARQLVTSGTGVAWVDQIDVGNPSATAADIAQDMPFIINGFVPEPVGLSFVGLAALGLLARRRA